MNKAHIKYLENRLFEIGATVSRYLFENSSTPTQSSISESDQAEMEEYIDNIKILVNTLGHKVFEGKRELKPPEEFELESFFIKATRGADAQGEPTSGGFLVVKGSIIAGSTVASYSDSLMKLRNSIIDSGIINKAFEFTEDYIFTSPSYAAAIVMGRNANGLTEWKRKDGKTLKEYESY